MTNSTVATLLAVIRGANFVRLAMDINGHVVSVAANRADVLEMFGRAGLRPTDLSGFAVVEHTPVSGLMQRVTIMQLPKEV